ncbi:MAG: sulfatase [Candidatus Omnitrophica bacterium]|nr:sulfatase [Candidatus Omnitrophota bacterium]
MNARYYAPKGLCIIALLIVSYGCSKKVEEKRVDAFQNGAQVVVDTEFDFVYALDQAELVGDYINPDWVTMPDPDFGEKTYWGIFEHAPAQIHFKDVYVGENAELDFQIGILPGAWQNEGDGVRFEIIATLPDGNDIQCFSRYIDPKKNEDERRWIPQKVALPQISNAAVTFSFVTHPGENAFSNNKDSDWAIWGSPVLRSSGRKTPYQKSTETNVILVTIDTCRADYLGCYGNDWIDTPNLDRLAEEGVLFENLFAASSTTSPSHVSILTSMQPNQHGVINNGYPFPKALPRLPQFFVENGCKTGAVVSVYHLNDAYYGFGKWFDWFNNLALKWTEKGANLFSSTRGGRASVSAAIDWLEQVHNNSFFLWLHVYDPHAPYFAEGDLHKKYYTGDPKNPAHHSMDGAVYQKSKSPESLAWIDSFKDLEYFRREYGAEITFVDSQIGRLLGALERLDLHENTLLVITADHGENVGEHDIYFDHWMLHNTDIHVPLIFWLPKSLPQGKRIAADVSHIDIAPTILDVIGDRKNPVADEIFDGISLKPLWENEQQAAPNRILTSNGLLYTEMAGWNDRFKVIWELRDAPYHDRAGLLMDRVWIFDRLNDPGEINPIACFYWGDESERSDFEKTLRREMMSIEGENRQERQLLRKMELIKERACQKTIPNESQLRQWAAQGAHGVKLDATRYADDPQFFPAIQAILEAMKAGVCTPSLEDRLKNIIDISVLENGQLDSAPIFDKTLQEIQRSLGYGNAAG